MLLSLETLNFLCTHEAGHVVLCETIGAHIFAVSITPKGGAVVRTLTESKLDPLIHLGGYFATQLNPEGLPAEYLTWGASEEDRKQFKNRSSWMGHKWTYTEGRQVTIDILRTNKNRLFTVRDELLHKYKHLAHY